MNAVVQADLFNKHTLEYLPETTACQLLYHPENRRASGGSVQSIIILIERHPAFILGVRPSFSARLFGRNVTSLFCSNIGDIGETLHPR